MFNWDIQRTWCVIVSYTLCFDTKGTILNIKGKKDNMNAHLNLIQINIVGCSLGWVTSWPTQPNPIQLHWVGFHLWLADPTKNNPHLYGLGVSSVWVTQDPTRDQLLYFSHTHLQLV